MKTRTPRTSTARIQVVGLLVLAGVFSVARPALAQMEEACPLLPGTTPPADPSVTAQQVEDGTASLMEFARAARDQYKSTVQGLATIEETLYFGCLVRQEGGPWRSGDTYLVQLRLGGRMIIHAKDMALSGGLLNNFIYAAILQALGVPLTDLFNAINPDPAVAEAAQAAIIERLRQEPDAAFDATIPIPPLVPAGIPGASGHAAVYVSATTGLPVVLLAGFDLTESHLQAEMIDPGDPSITAEEVVSRSTLKEFVAEAWDYLVDFRQSGDIANFSKVKRALRDPSGPWRHGSVYLYVLDLTSNIIWFHGANPNRFELRPLIPTVRDVVTGELVLPQVLEAAKSSSEGGFLEYYWDDPNDDSDSADIPKVGYARQFTGSVRTVGGNQIPMNMIIGSGFYLSSREGEVTRRFHVLPHLADGGGWRSSLLVTNVSEEASQCTLQLYGLGADRFQDYSAGGVTASGSMATFELSASGGYLVWPTRGEAAEASGYATLDCVHPVAAQIVFEWIGGGMRPTAMATVFSSPGATVFQIPVLTPAATVGFAIANDSNFEASCGIALYDPQGTMVGQTMVSVPMKSNHAALLNLTIPIPETFLEGSAKAECDRQVSMIGLHYELEGSNILTFTTLPPAILDTTPATMESASQ